jgi:phosphatidylglycerol:prolipoprotein diacylglycerol transferase
MAGIERFIIEFFRAKDDRFFGPFTTAQMIAIAIAVGGTIWMYARWDVTPATPGIMAAPQAA